MKETTKKFWIGIAIGFVVAVVLTLVVTNWIGGQVPIERRVPASYPVKGPDFQRTLRVLLGPPLLGGNRVEVLENGVEIFPAMLAAIRDAEQTINFETYVYWQGSVAERFSDALSERARAGVRVNVLLDWFGSNKVDGALIEAMREAGVKVHRYQPPRWNRLEKFNSRTHRKLLIVDGKVGFTGGVGIADEWTGDAQDPEHWRDLHFRVTGPVVAQLQVGFLDNWIETEQEILMGDEYFPPLEPTGEILAHNFISSPDEGSESVQLLFLLAIAGSRERLMIGTPYFVPDEIAVRTLVEAVKRGVKVQILMPGPHTDMQLIRRASRASWGKLLEAGVELWEYQPTMYHTKMMVVDGYLISVGSTNFDNRSFKLNDEANLNALDYELAARLERIFEEDLAQSRRITYEMWKSRPLFEKLREHASSILESQL